MPASQPANQRAPEAEAPSPVRRLRRAERREQILVAATQAFARAGFAATSLDDIATQAGRQPGDPVPPLRLQDRPVRRGA